MHFDEYFRLAEQSIAGAELPRETAYKLLTSSEVETLPLLNATYLVRKHFTGKSVKIHIINNAANGFCPEDCGYCAQAKTSAADIEEYPLKPDHEILAEAKNAYEKGAYRYCMVFAGRGPSQRRVEHLAKLIREIKSKYPIQICVSAGLMDHEKSKVLKEAGLDRLNHNLNTSEKHYGEICTTHTYKDRLDTLQGARKAGIQLCSGAIIGMNEDVNDILEVAYTLRSLKVESIPVNLLIPIAGTTLQKNNTLTPDFCLRVLCVFRLLNPACELRVAAGREINLRSMEVMALYAANSLFLDGYLNTKGAGRAKTLQMIKDAGFTVESEHDLDELLANEEKIIPQPRATSAADKVILKDVKDLRPHQTSTK